MNRKQEIERLATKVMGGQPTYTAGYLIGWRFPAFGFRSNDWNPFESWNDAGMVAETVEGFLLYTGSDPEIGDCLFCEVGGPGNEGVGKRGPEAISIAALKWLDATKKKGVANES